VQLERPRLFAGSLEKRKLYKEYELKKQEEGLEVICRNPSTCSAHETKKWLGTRGRDRDRDRDRDKALAAKLGGPLGPTGEL
jgi:hypothetical protein